MPIHEADEDEVKRARAKLDEIGPAEARLIHARAGFPHTWDRVVIAWLAEQDEPRRAPEDAPAAPKREQTTDKADDRGD